MKKAILLLIAVVLFAIQPVKADQVKSWSLLVPFNNDTYTLLNVLKDGDKFSVASVEINMALSSYSSEEKDGVFEIQMEDGVHKAQIVDGELFYQLLPGSYSVLLNSVEDFDPVYTDVNGSFNIDALRIRKNFEKSQSQKEENSDSITVPSGVYIAGEDFLPGTYRIELAEGLKYGHVKLYENKEKVKKAFSYIHDYDLGEYYGSDVVGKIEILEGNALEVINSTILLKKYEGLR